jgi:hypothetical protein
VPASMTRLLALLAVLLLAAPLQAAGELRVIELQHRPAEGLLTVLRPLIEDGEALTGSGYRLVLSAPPRRQAALAEVIARLDRPPRTLLVHVRHTRSRLGAPPGGRRHATHGMDEDHRVRVLEGEPALIETGEAIPLPQLGLTPHGVVEGIVYEPVTRGFWVLARVSGERVTVKISDRREALVHGPGGPIGSEALVTTATARLGEWVELGGSGARGIAEGRYGTRLGATEGRLLIKVEMVP